MSFIVQSVKRKETASCPSLPRSAHSTFKYHDWVDPILEPCFLGIPPVASFGVWSEDGNLFLGSSAAGFKQNFPGAKEYKSIQEEFESHGDLGWSSLIQIPKL